MELSSLVLPGVEWLWPLAFGSVFSSHEFILRKVVDDHVVEFLCKFQDTTEDVHLLTPDHSSVSTASDWFESAHVVTDFAPLLGVEVKCPQISELIVVVVLASEDVEFVVVDDVGVCLLYTSDAAEICSV